MEGIHPKFVLSKRFPVHAAVEQLNLPELEKLLTPASDARFHFGRKLTGTDISVLHQACAMKLVSCVWEERAVVEIVRVLLELGAPHSDKDQAGQTPLFYAVSHCLAEQLVPLLLKAGANPNVQRKDDLWSPLFVAAMLGRTQVANLLLQSGADPQLEDSEGRTAEAVAREFRNFATADIISSPRAKYRPSFPSEWTELLAAAQNDDCLILWDEHVDWRGQDGLTLLHIAAWTGNLNLFRAFCNDAKGRKLLPLSTTGGLSALCFAIINGQTAIIDEYFQNRVAKKAIYFQSDVVKATQQTIPHLLFQFAPLVHPKVLLKRKDLTSGIVNALDCKGNSPLVVCAMRNSRDTVRRLLSSKAANERSLFDLGLQNQYGKTALHYLVVNNDKHNVRLLLNLLSQGRHSGDPLNAVDVNDLYPLLYCLRLGHDEIAEAILTHPVAKERLNLCQVDNKGRSLLHMAAERGNTVFWTHLVARQDIDPLLRDVEGNTALMTAAASGQEAILSLWMGQMKEAPKQHLDLVLGIQNNRGENLFMLVARHLGDTLVKAFIDKLNLTACIDQRDREGASALLILCSLENKWVLVEQLLSNRHLDEVAMDVHPTDRSGNSALALALMERAKAERQWQAAKAKTGMLGEERAARQLVERLWRIVKLLVTKERDLHGMNITTGRDVGMACIKQQLECNRRIRPPTPDEVLQEFTGLYSVVFRPKKKPEPPPKLEEVPAEARRPPPLAVSSFQQAINNIYKETQQQGNDKAVMDSLRLQTNGSLTSKDATKSTSKTNFNDLEFDYYGESVLDQQKKGTNEEKDVNGNSGVYLNGAVAHAETAPPPAEPENEPSVEEIRAQWKKNRSHLGANENEFHKKEVFNSEAFFESLLKKHEQGIVGERKEEGNELEERLNEEIVWALQQKIQAEQEAQQKQLAKTKPADIPIPKPAQNVAPKKIETKKPAQAPESKPSMDSQLADIEKKLMAKKKAEPVVSNAPGLVMSSKMREQLQREQEERELLDLENAINEEIRWAMEEKKRLEEERGVTKQQPLLPAAVVPAASLPPTAAADSKLEAAAEERRRKASEERLRIERLQKEAEELIRKAKAETGGALPDRAVTAGGSPAAGPADVTDKAAEGSFTTYVASADSSGRLEREKPDNSTKTTERKETRKILPPPEPEKKLTVELRSVKDKNPTPTIRERIEEQKRREEERLRRLQEEKDKIKNLERVVEEKLTAVRTGSDKDSSGITEIKVESPITEQKETVLNGQPRIINGVEIIDNSLSVNGKHEGGTLPLTPDGEPAAADPLAQLPRWKREKLLRDNRSKSTGESPPNGNSTANSPLPSSAVARKASLPAQSAAASSSPSTVSPAHSNSCLGADSDSDFMKLPRWKREKILRERRQSQDQLVVTPMLLISANVKETDNDIKLSSLLAAQEATSVDDLSATVNVLNRDHLPEKDSIETSNLIVEDKVTPLGPPEAAPEPVRRRRNRRPESEDVEEAVAGQVTRPARKSRIEDSVAEAEYGDGVRSLGVEVDVRPGYAHATTQTDPVQTRDMAL